MNIRLAFAKPVWQVTARPLQLCQADKRCQQLVVSFLTTHLEFYLYGSAPVVASNKVQTLHFCFLSIISRNDSVLSSPNFVKRALYSFPSTVDVPWQVSENKSPTTNLSSSTNTSTKDSICVCFIQCMVTGDSCVLWLLHRDSPSIQSAQSIFLPVQTHQTWRLCVNFSSILSVQECTKLFQRSLQKCDRLC